MPQPMLKNEIDNALLQKVVQGGRTEMRQNAF